MQAVHAAPVVPRDKLEESLRVLSRLTQVITRLCLERIRANQAEAKVRELNRTLEEMVAERTNELRTALHKLEGLASHDPLTKVFNRRHFETVLAQEIGRKKRYSRPLSLIMFDLDHFKRINDSFGHASGDTVLKKTVEVAQSCLRQNDLLARWGGEEFTIILPETALPQAMQIAERIRQGIQQTRMLPDTSVTCSLGVVELSDETEEELLKHADTAMYAAKEKGRNRVEAHQTGPAAN
jgi:diguanylate cyclase (GGDEF)-like protein